MNTVFTVTLESTYKQNSTCTKRNTGKMIGKKIFCQNIPFCGQKKLSTRDILMGNDNPSPFEDYFPCEKISHFLIFTAPPSFDQI